jgi:hypothetical protein
LANYQTHLAVSGMLGIGYGAAASAAFGFSAVSAALAGCVTAFAGMLPDLDSGTGRPVRAVFGILAAVAPALMLNRLESWGGSRDAAIALAVLLFVAIRFGAASVLGMFAVHRGMFHSLPALVIAAELTFLACKFDGLPVRALLAGGTALGFASHLVLDEIYSVSWNGGLVRLKSSAGSAMKLLGKDWTANFAAYGLLLLCTYLVLIDTGFIQVLPSAPK